MCSYCVIASLQWFARNGFENVVKKKEREKEKLAEKREKEGEGERGRERAREKLPCRL